MGWNDHVDWQLYEEIEDLVAEGRLEEEMPAYGVAQKVIHEGYDSLSPNQGWVFDTYVAPALERRKKELRLLEIANNAAP
jgi:hypothetical protein